MNFLNQRLFKLRHRHFFELFLGVLLLLSTNAIAWAQFGQSVIPQNLWRTWNTEFAVLFPIELITGVYALGVFRIWLRAGRGHRIRYRNIAAFTGMLLALFIALISPLDALSHALFSAHMLQHLILILIVPPLLIWSELPSAFLYALPKPSAHWIGHAWHNAHSIRRGWSLLTTPVVAWVASTGFLWFWHLPAFFQATLQNEALHGIEHLCFVGTSLLFWWVLLRPKRQKYKDYILAAVYVFLSAMQGTFLGFLLVFAGQPWYGAYSQSVAAWNLTLLQDQQLAGLIMWIPVGTLFTLLAVVYFLAWFQTLEQRSERAQAKSGVHLLP